MTDFENRRALGSLVRGGLRGLPPEDFVALYEAVVKERTRRKDPDGLVACGLVGYRSFARHFCECGLGFVKAEALRVHVYQELKGRDPTFFPRVGDVVTDRNGTELAITGLQDGVQAKEGPDSVTMGLGYYRALCGIEFGGKVVHYAGD